MSIRDLAHFARSQDVKLEGAAAIGIIASMIAVLFAGSTVLTPQ